MSIHAIITGKLSSIIRGKRKTSHYWQAKRIHVQQTSPQRTLEAILLARGYREEIDEAKIIETQNRIKTISSKKGQNNANQHTPLNANGLNSLIKNHRLVDGFRNKIVLLSTRNTFYLQG